jgi:hypothetical protein
MICVVCDSHILSYEHRVDKQYGADGYSQSFVNAASRGRGAPWLMPGTTTLCAVVVALGVVAGVRPLLPPVAGTTTPTGYLMLLLVAVRTDLNAKCASR